jgi:Asp-tRNA(Asn)/Glu-tRNA(Gln) amidotransferase A subunit family amidase
VLRELVEMVRAGSVSAVELVERAYERVGSLNGDVNAVVGEPLKAVLGHVGLAHRDRARGPQARYVETVPHSRR